MSLNIESSETPHAECMNGPNDVYIYFKGGFYVWNWLDDPELNVWFNGEMFTFQRPEIHSTRAACRLFNEWAGKQARETPWYA